MLAQTNQIKYDCFVFHSTENKKIIFSRSKIRIKNPGHVFLDFILFFNIAVEKFGKKKREKVNVGALERDFSKLRISRFWSKF